MTSPISEATTALKDVIEKLLGPDGCPWDKEQTPESLCDYLLEETFELVDAIRSGKIVDVREELGDVMFLILFISRLYECKGFSLADSMQESAAKMIRRHPHVFDDASVNSIADVWANWERIKRSEKKEGEEDKPKGAFDSLPKGLPPLLKAYRLNSKAARIGFTWPDDAAVDRQLESEWQEFNAACATDDKDAQEREFGDVLFTMVELGRRKGLKANAALNNTNIKFLDRFERMEALARSRGKVFADLSFSEMDALWDEVKKGA
ncbi:nucleoside triphosphate pyrophosphohydrolase [Desulfovibrio subterraneus]|jgi:ATP diphosphatase|uniref:Nucleoside triphosphate pyrophosphohydrolase n=1 Tax=Desulfovibrio subterraneus TaxID=2718620 RepID=A0A7J0BI97_9BACT|nr:nucleoside triphosphate pyrophosphohydrolase [Desulfovibrio subterraneus]WBF67661.1 nucleoside triphosphate pyrophosphohydrolase [Desulfovibrio subterraneus]GFM33493.1 nucleoside triphosphate pyrophosphohydrolase [Desulfovibrio subterraneus]